MVFHSNGRRDMSGPIVVPFQGDTVTWGLAGSLLNWLLAFLREVPTLFTPILAPDVR